MAIILPQQNKKYLAKDFIPLAKKLTQEQKKFALVLMKSMKEPHNNKEFLRGNLEIQTEARDQIG